MKFQPKREGGSSTCNTPREHARMLFASLSNFSGLLAYYAYAVFCTLNVSSRFICSFKRKKYAAAALVAGSNVRVSIKVGLVEVDVHGDR